MIKKAFGKSIGDLIGAKIVVFLQDDQYIEGILIAVKEDHLVVKMKDIIFYFALNQIHALSKNAKEFRISTVRTPFVNKNNLTDVIETFKYKWVTINTLMKRSFVGLLSKVAEDHILLITAGDVLYVQKSFIASIYEGNYEITNQQATIENKKVDDNSQEKSASENKEAITMVMAKKEKENQSINWYGIQSGFKGLLSLNFGNRANSLKLEAASQPIIEQENVEELNELVIDKEQPTNLRINLTKRKELRRIPRKYKPCRYSHQLVAKKVTSIGCIDAPDLDIDDCDSSVIVLTVQQADSLLEGQYYALKKYAEKMYQYAQFGRNECGNQYFALMKHAERMHGQVRSDRLSK